MPRLVPLLAGLAAATAVTYKFSDRLKTDQNNITGRLENAKTTLENAVTTELNKTPTYLSDSQKYVSNRLVPSGTQNTNNRTEHMMDIEPFFFFFFF
jgi:predicted DNA-binding ArsR family transcriptional regulator